MVDKVKSLAEVLRFDYLLVTKELFYMASFCKILQLVVIIHRRCDQSGLKFNL